MGNSGRDPQKTPGDRPLGPVQAAEEYAGDLLHRVGDHRALGQFQVQRGADQLAGNLQELGRERSQLIFRQAAVSLVHRFRERIADARADPDHATVGRPRISSIVRYRSSRCRTLAST